MEKNRNIKLEIDLYIMHQENKISSATYLQNGLCRDEIKLPGSDLLRSTVSVRHKCQYFMSDLICDNSAR